MGSWFIAVGVIYYVEGYDGDKPSLVLQAQSHNSEGRNCVEGFHQITICIVMAIGYKLEEVAHTLCNYYI